MNTQNNSKSRQALESLQLQFPATHELGPKPVYISNDIENNRALAHTIRIAAYDYPLAYGGGYKEHSVKEDVKLFSDPDTRTAVIGVGNRILGGIAIARHVALCWDMHPADELAYIPYLFRIRGIKPSGVQHVGKTMLSFALDSIGQTSAEGVSITVVKANTPAINMLSDVGFESSFGGHTLNGSQKLINMQLNGIESILEAHNILQAQL